VNLVKQRGRKREKQKKKSSPKIPFLPIKIKKNQKGKRGPIHATIHHPQQKQNTFYP